MAKRTSARKKMASNRKVQRAARSKRPSSTKARQVQKRAGSLSQTAPRHAASAQVCHVPLAPASGTAKRGIYARLMRDRRALRIASIVLGLIALLHLVRFVTGFTLIVDDVVLPVTASGFIVIIFGVLAVWYYRLSLD